MSTVKLNEKEKKNLKLVSKILYIIGRIGAILTKVAFGFTVVAMIVIPILLAKLEVRDNKLIYGNKSILELEESANGVEIVLKDNDNIKIEKLSKKDVEEVKEIISERNKYVTIALCEVGFIFVLVGLYFFIKICNYLNKLFTNIYNEDTPFTLDNVNYIKKMSYYMIACIFIPAFGEALLSEAFLREVDLGIDMFNVIEIIFLYAVALVFDYGYKLQQDSKSKTSKNKKGA